MNSKHINLIYPQWQGGGQDLSTYYGALELHELYFSHVPVIEAGVSTEKVTHVENDIFGYGSIVDQMQKVHDLIGEEAPDTIFTVGGGCDANIPSVSYLNHKLDGDMTILWFDSHGDLNTPKSSPSKHFYGMPLRTLLGEGNQEIVKSLPSRLVPSQVALMGVRDLDVGEQEYITKHAIPVLSVLDIEQHPDTVVDVIRSKGSSNLYIHIDLDVLEPTQFPYVPLPVPNGLNMDTLLKLLRKLDMEFTIVGLGLVEYKPTEKKRFELFEEMIQMGTSLST